MASVYGKPKDYADAVTVAVNTRMPVKIGALSDPCPPIEPQFRITEAFLRILNLYDYPVQIQTKNPKIMAGILERIGPGANVAVSVTLISVDEEWSRRVETGAPSPRARLEGMAKIAELGYPVFAKVQPAIYPVILEQLPQIVPAIKEVGCWGFNTEGLKVRISMPKYEQRIWRRAFGNVRDLYKGEMGIRESSDWVLRDEYKLQYIRMAIKLAEEYGLRYFSADNTPLGYGDGYECCGTEVLRQYTLFQYNLRTKAFGVFDPTDELAQCLFNFTRATAGNRSFRTVRQWVDLQSANAR